ncbi:MAG: methylated-DNA--[protein]-cysteine S-methyltransferase [Fulvivirga sp.]|nr:methylated-DNA--[protein]-cysteine S-methyltransferase [Fulvivirga sp.]
MSTQAQLDYERIEKAIHFITQNYQSQPSLNEVAQNVHMSPYHFQRLFSRWAGLSPKKFLQYVSVEHAKKILKRQVSTFDTAHKIGLSGTGRLHDLFLNIEGMTPGEFKKGGQNLVINYSQAVSPFGKILIASTTKGICHMNFYKDEHEALSLLHSQYPNAQILQKPAEIHENALAIFSSDGSRLQQIKLHVKGSAFQLKVWHALLNIPRGHLQTYGDIARQIGNPKASRAVGTAIGSNPVAFLIPCHRVIQSSGALGGYRWGNTRKTAIIGWEAAKNDAEGYF